MLCRTKVRSSVSLALCCWWLIQSCQIQRRVLLPCQLGRLTATAPSSRRGAFWLKPEQQEWKREGNSTLPRGAAASVGDFWRCSSHQRCFCCWKKRNARGSSAYVLNSLNPVKKGSGFFFILFKAVWNQNLPRSELKERHWFYRGLTGRGIGCLSVGVT